MLDRRTLLILALAVLAAAGGWWLQHRMQDAPPVQPPPPPGVEVLGVGDSVGSYALPDIHGTQTALASWHGKVLLVNIWATWCAPCRQEMPMLAQMQREHAADGLQVVGIAMDQPPSATAFLKHTPVGYPILIGIDADPVPTTTFGDTAGLLPYSVLVGRDGRILATKLGALDPALVNDWLRQANEAAKPPDH